MESVRARRETLQRQASLGGDRAADEAMTRAANMSAVYSPEHGQPSCL